MGTWTALANQPTFHASTMLLLTDGAVMCQDEAANRVGSPHWWKLTPNSSGDYIHGTWSVLADGPNSPLYYASAVLKDGRVFVAGGEYNGTSTAVDLLAAQIYNPVADSWETIGTPAGWSNIGDAPCCILPDGRLLLGNINTTQTAIYDPAANSWAAAASKGDKSSEETWTLLPDQTVLTVQCNNSPHAEKYVIAADHWVPAGSTPSSLVEASSTEIGPALLLPDGRAFAVGATGSTALYTLPAIANQTGSWSSGPSFPEKSGQQLIAKDAPGCLMPNGLVLCTAGPAGGCSSNFGGYCPPTYFFEYDPTANTLTEITAAANNSNPVFNGRMLLLPTGQVLFASGDQDIEVYTPDGGPDASWRPQIVSHPGNVAPGNSYTLSGRQINGLSQAVSYGDDATMATNYPLVRLRDSSGNVTYCRTHDHSTMGVATGSVVQTTRFTVPSVLAHGAYRLVVVANGIASDEVAITVGARKRVKELKQEIIEKPLILENLKLVFENDQKINEGDPFEQLGDLGWVEIIQTLAARSDQVEALLEQRAFIRQEERPEVGGQAGEESNGQAGEAKSE